MTQELNNFIWACKRYVDTTNEFIAHPIGYDPTNNEKDSRTLELKDLATECQESFDLLMQKYIKDNGYEFSNAVS